jgi:hypothetical protein
VSGGVVLPPLNNTTVWALWQRYCASSTSGLRVCETRCEIDEYSLWELGLAILMYWGICSPYEWGLDFSGGLW